MQIALDANPSKVMEDLVTRVPTEHDLEARFRARAARGDRVAGLTLLDQLDQAEAEAKGFR